MFEKPAIQRFIAQARKHSYRPRQLITRGGEAGGLFLLLEGSASMVLDHESGQQAVLGYLHPGEFFGECGLGQDRASGGVTIRARSPAVVAFVGAGGLAQLIAQHPGLALDLAGQLAARLDRAHRQIADHFFLDVTQRLTRTLSKLCEQPDAHPHKDGVSIHIKRQELAFMIGCSREMVARVLKVLEADGQITTNGHTLLVHRPLLPPTGAAISRVAD